ncbi:MAG TPA: hypothetical protein VF629_11060 [Hymenobacter sp.]|jgi:hypothetical protein|uniref:hypothetical protein n=1 Tax=Hymenobacter sp. TaxID=1898978 RepID=UPI002ED7C8FF
MSNYLFLLLPPLALAAFVGFFSLIVKGLAVAGWQRLAKHYRVAALPPGPTFRLSLATVGGVRYRGAVKAGATAEGLSLATGFPFGTGHAPMLIPWSAIGPVHVRQMLWLTSYETEVQTPTGTVGLTFASNDLMEAAKPWLKMA